LRAWVKEHRYFTVDSETYLNNSSQWSDKPVFETPELTREERVEALKMVRDVRKKIRYNFYEVITCPEARAAAALVAKAYVNDWVQDKLMKSGALRKNLKKSFTRVSN
jgi:sulfur relay (sulfurtransferase) DsrC/TusE family protein